MDHQGFYREVGRRIRDARKRRKPVLTQESLAHLVSLTRTSITNIEKGRQKFLLHTLADIAAVVGVPMGELLPEPERDAGRHLDQVLKHRPIVEKEWIRSAFSATKKGSNDDGT